MKAIVLAAGLGTRLGLPGTPKCLVQVGGAPLIDRHLQALGRLGIPKEEVTAVVGADSEVWTAANQAALRAKVPRVAVNERNRTTQSTYSLLLGLRASGPGDTLVVDGDLAYLPEVPAKAVAGGGDVTLIAFRTRGTTGTRVVADATGRVTGAAEGLPSDLVYAGILHLRAAAFPVVVEMLATGAYDARILAFLLDDLARRVDVHVVEVPEEQLVNVNTREDLARALKVIA